MSVSSFSIMQIVWLVSNVAVGVLMITASILLLRERHFSVWLILAGSCLSALSGLTSYLVILLLARTVSPEKIGQIYGVLGGIGGLGWLLLAIGLFLYALHRRS